MYCIWGSFLVWDHYGVIFGVGAEFLVHLPGHTV